MTPEILSQIEADAEASVGARFVDVTAEYFANTRDRNRRVSTAHTPGELAARFDEPIPASGRSVDDVLRRIQGDVIPDCNHLFHPRYVGHQIAGPLPAAVWTESITAALNQSVAVWEMSPGSRCWSTASSRG